MIKPLKGWLQQSHFFAKMCKKSPKKSYYESLIDLMNHQLHSSQLRKVPCSTQIVENIVSILFNKFLLFLIMYSSQQSTRIT